MSLELTIENLTVAINSLIDTINHQGSHAFIPRATTSVAGGSFLNTASVNQPQEQRLAPIMDDKSRQMKSMLESVAQMHTPVMPAAPTFEIPQTITQIPQNGAPFSDPKGLIEFVMTSYKNLGPAKGAGIQGVLTGLGYQNINDVKAEHYAALFSGIEALKG